MSVSVIASCAVAQQAISSSSTEITVGQHLKIISITSAASAWRLCLLAMGVRPGAVVRVIGIAPAGDPILLELEGVSFAVRRNEWVSSVVYEVCSSEIY